MNSQMKLIREREQRRRRKQRLTTANNQSYLTQLHVIATDKYAQNRMQKYSAVTDVTSGIAQNVSKSQMLDINFSQM